MATIYVFPGQGSQRAGMGIELFKEFPHHTAMISGILGYSIEELCGPDPRQELNRTEFTQPALFVVSALSYIKKIQATGSPPDFVAGHSLGEYNALFAAGVFDFETGVRLVQKRGALMSHASGGGMAAVVGMTAAEVQELLRNNGLNDVEIANLNAPRQIVISGPADRVHAAKPVFERAGARTFVPLKVSGAFHSRYMAAARKEFETFLTDFQFASQKIPVISNVHARPYRSDDVIQNLADQITSPVRWTETIQFLLGQPNPEFEEIGPGVVLAGLIRRIKAG